MLGVFAGKIFLLESTASDGHSHINDKVEVVVTQDSGSGQPAAKVVISSADADTTIVKDTMTEYCHIQNVRFQDLMETLEPDGVSLQRKVHLIFGDPPHSIRYEAEKPDFSYDLFSKQDIGDMVDLEDITLRSCWHNLFFCSSVQFLDWVSTVQKWTETVPPSDDEDEHAERERNFFQFEK